MAVLRFAEKLDFGGARFQRCDKASLF